jgi:hypothetical protein
MVDGRQRLTIADISIADISFAAFAPSLRRAEVIVPRSGLALD